MCINWKPDTKKIQSLPNSHSLGLEDFKPAVDQYMVTLMKRHKLKLVLYAQKQPD